MSAKAYKGLGMEGAVAKWYPGLTRKSLKDFQALAQHIVEQLRSRSRVLEVAPGPTRAEMYRVLKSGGRALIIDLRRDASSQLVGQAVDAMNLGTVNRIITKLTFRFMLLQRAYTKAEFEELISHSKFARVEIAENLTGLDILLTKGGIDRIPPFGSLAGAEALCYTSE